MISQKAQSQQQQQQQQQQSQQSQQQQECSKKKELKWSSVLAEQESISDYIIDNMCNWDKFPLSVKIQCLEQFNILIESATFDKDDDIVLSSNCNFNDQLKHHNPRIVWITLNNLISYTTKAQAINYNVPHVVCSLISKVMIRKEFREQTKCRDGLNFGIQEIFSNTYPKPICETLYLFEVLVSKKDPEIKEFLKQFLPQIFEYSQNQYLEVRQMALKLFATMIKEYGESYVHPYKTKLKSNQIDFLNKLILKDQQNLQSSSQQLSSQQSAAQPNSQYNLNAVLLSNNYALASSAYLSKPNSAIPASSIKSVQPFNPFPQKSQKSLQSNPSQSNLIKTNEKQQQQSSVHEKQPSIHEKQQLIDKQINEKVINRNVKSSSVHEKPSFFGEKLLSQQNDNKIQSFANNQKGITDKLQNLNAKIFQNYEQQQQNNTENISQTKHQQTLASYKLSQNNSNKNNSKTNQSNIIVVDKLGLKNNANNNDKSQTIKKNSTSKISSISSETSLKTFSKKIKSKDESLASINDLSKSRSSINSHKVSKKKQSDTMSLADNDDSSYEKYSELGGGISSGVGGASKKSRQYSADISSQKKKFGVGFEKSIKVDLPEILEAGFNGTDNNKFKKNQPPKIDVNKERKNISNNNNFKKDKNFITSLHQKNIGNQRQPSSSSTSTINSQSQKKFKSTQDLKFKKSVNTDINSKVQLKNNNQVQENASNQNNNKNINESNKNKNNIIPKIKKETLNGIDDDSFYAEPNIMNDNYNNENDNKKMTVNGIDDDSYYAEPNLMNDEINNINHDDNIKIKNNQINFKKVTPNGIDDDSCYAEPNMMNDYEDDDKSNIFDEEFEENNKQNIQISNSTFLSQNDQEEKGENDENQIEQQDQQQHSQIDKFIANVLHINDDEYADRIQNKVLYQRSNNNSNNKKESTPHGIDHQSLYAQPNLLEDQDEGQEQDDNNNENQIQIINFNSNNVLQLKKLRSKSLQEIRTPHGIDSEQYYAQPNISSEQNNNIKQDDQIQNIEEDTQPGDAMQQKSISKGEYVKIVYEQEDESQSQNKLNSPKSEQDQVTKNGSEDDKQQQQQSDLKESNDLVQSIILQKQKSISENEQPNNKNSNNPNELYVVQEEQSQYKQSGSIGRQINDLSIQMSFLNKENQNNKIIDSSEQNQQQNQQILLNNLYSQISQDQISILEEEKSNQNYFYQLQNDLSNQANNNNNKYNSNNKNNYQIRGYFFNNDIQEILSVVESAEHKNYFFSQSNHRDSEQQYSLQQQQQQQQSQYNSNLKEKDIFINADNKKKLQQQQQQSPFKRPQSSSSSQSQQRNIIIDEEIQQAHQTIIKSNQMNENVLKSYILIFDNKLVDKLNQQQKDKILYIVNRDNLNQWFNSQEYDNVSIISFFILYLGKQFERNDNQIILQKFWNFQKFLSFNNAMIQSETIHVMNNYFKIIQKYPSIKSRIKLRCLRDTINKLIKIIPVSRDKLFDEAFAFLEFLFELDTYNNYIFDAINEVLQSNVPKQIVSSLRILSNFLRLYGEKRLNSLKPFMHIIKTISFSANLQVRNAAIEFYQEAYSWMGDQIFEYTRSLKKSQLIQLEKAFSQVILKERRPLKCPEDVFCPIINNDLFEKQQNIFFSECDEEIQKQESYIRKALAVQEWVNKDDLLEKIINDASNHPKLKEQNYSHLTKILLELIKDWNKYLIENTLTLIRGLALKLKKNFTIGSILLFESIFELYTEQRSINRDKITKALVSLFIASGLSQLQNIIEKLFMKKKNIKEILNVLNFSLRKTDTNNIIKIINIVQIYLTDKDSNTKIAAFDLFGTIKYLFGNLIIEQNINPDIKNNRFILQKIQESHAKCAKMKSLTMQKKKLEEVIKLSNSLSMNSEMSTASYDRQYFYVQLQNCSSSFKKNNQLPIQQFKQIKKQELLQYQQQQQLNQSYTQIYQDSFVHEFLSSSQMQAGLQMDQLNNDDIDEI